MAGNRKVASSIPGSSWLSVEVSLSKAPNPNCSRRAGCHHAWLTTPSLCECVHEWVNVRQCCKALYKALYKCSKIKMKHGATLIIIFGSFHLIIQFDITQTGRGCFHLNRTTLWASVLLFCCCLRITQFPLGFLRSPLQNTD